MGIETYCVAWDKGAVCKQYADHFRDISIVDKEKVAEFCIRERIDGIVSNALELAVPTLAYVHDHCGLNGNTELTALQTRNKKAMRQRVAACGACRQPQFHTFKEGDNLPEVISPVFVKPTDSSASQGVSKACNEEELQQAILHAMDYSANKEVLIEQFIDGAEISVESLSYHGRHYILAVTDKVTSGYPSFMEIGHHQPSNIPTRLQADIKAALVKVLDALGVENSASHAEFKIDEKGDFYLIEIASRGGGGHISNDLVQLSTGYDYIQGMIEVALDIFDASSISLGSQCAGINYITSDTLWARDFVKQHLKSDWLVKYDIDTPLKEIRRYQDRTEYFIYQSDHRIDIHEEDFNFRG